MIVSFDAEKDFFRIQGHGYPSDDTLEPPGHISYNLIVKFFQKRNQRIPRHQLQYRSQAQGGQCARFIQQRHRHHTRAIDSCTTQPLISMKQVSLRKSSLSRTRAPRVAKEQLKSSAKHARAGNRGDMVPPKLIGSMNSLHERYTRNESETLGRNGKS